MKKTDITKLREAVRNCKVRLNMKMNEAAGEDAFDQIVGYGRDLLKVVQDPQVQAVLKEFPVENEDSLDLKGMLNTSEDDLNEKGLNEALLVRANRLQEGRSHRQLIADYKAEGGEVNMRAYREWFAEQPESATLAPPATSFFTKEMGGAPSMGGGGYDDGNEISIVKPNPNYKPSDNLMNLINACGGLDAMSEVQSAKDSVVERYELIEVIAKAIVRNRYNKHYYILAGDPGIGKTYIIKQVLKQEGRNDVPYLTGSIGRSKSSIYAFLWKYKDEDLIILDDCDQILRADGNVEVRNILKGAMEAETGYTVGCSDPLMRKKVSSLIASGLEEDVDDDNLNRISESEEVEDEGMEDEDTGGEFELPESWTFNCRIIFISNLTQSQLDPALFSRCEVTVLTLTHEEFMLRLGAVIDGMDCGQKDAIFTEDEVKDAKALVLSVMASVIEAGENGQMLCGKQVILQPHFQFRAAKDLVSLWITLFRSAMEGKPASAAAEVKNEILRKWVRTCVIPKMSVSQADLRKLVKL